MDEVRVPEEDVALLRVEITRLEMVLGEEAANLGLVAFVIELVAAAAEFAGGDADILAEHVGQAMAAGIIDERSAIGMTVLERDPRRREVPERVRRHVDGVRVLALLAA